VKQRLQRTKREKTGDTTGGHSEDVMTIIEEQAENVLE
jgi:hypothetical protein